MSVENSNQAPIHLDDDAEKEVAQPPTIAEEQKADRPAVQEESPANKRIQDFATRATITGKEGIDRRKFVLLAVGLVAAVLFFLVTQFRSKPVKNRRQSNRRNNRTTIPLLRNSRRARRRSWIW
jgi:hypothetical protein